MKKLMGISLFLLLAVAGYAQTGTLTVNFKFMNIVDGYDHQTKTQVLIDGEVVGESKEGLESEGGSFTVNVPTGNHQLEVVNWALYEGEWEPHTIENDYSIDCTYTTYHTFKKKQKLFLVFDIDTQTHASWKKPVKMKKNKG